MKIWDFNKNKCWRSPMFVFILRMLNSTEGRELYIFILYLLSMYCSNFLFTQFLVLRGRQILARATIGSRLSKKLNYLQFQVRKQSRVIQLTTTRQFTLPTRYWRALTVKNTVSVMKLFLTDTEVWIGAAVESYFIQKESVTIWFRWGIHVKMVWVNIA